jgi:RNA polymerase sigma factor (sigma-70 family)
MTSGRYGQVLRQVGRLLGGGTIAGLGSAHLLERFASARDEVAFEALIHQHGPMVLGTCRRMLADPNDVEDAFQATFLVLARRAGSIQDADRLGPWLHGVARRVASRSRALSARRNALQPTGNHDSSGETPDALEAFELRAALDEELARLPEKYRAPLVLCYLEGLTHDEAAQRLRWPVGTVRSRLAGGRERLRDRLTRRGLAPASAVPAILARASIPSPLLSATVRLATSAGVPSAHVATLAKGVLIAMIANKLKLVGAIGLTAALTVGGAGIAAQQQGEGGQGQAKNLKVVASKPEDDLAKLQGRWRLREVDPARSDLAELPRVDWLFEGKTATLIERGETKQRSEFILGVQGGQKMIDLRSTEDGSKTLGFYRFLGDELEVCLGARNKPRPEAFRRDNSPYSEIFRFEKLPDGITKLDDRLKPVDEGPAERERLKKELEAEKTKKKELVLRSEKMQNEWWDLTEQETKEASTRRAILEAEGKTLGLENRISDAAIALLTLRLQRFDASNAQPPGVPAKEAADLKDEAKPSFYVHILELKKKEEELKYQLKLLEIDNKELSADFNPPMDRAKAKAAIDGMNQTIQKLERDVASKTAQIKEFENKVQEDRKQPKDTVHPEKPVETKPAQPAAEPEDPPKAAPVLTQLGGGWVVSIPREQDRVTVLNTETGFRSTHRFPSKLTRIMPVWNGSLAFVLEGPEVQQILVWSFDDKKWYPQDLKEPVTEASPAVDLEEVIYEIDRFFYIFSSQARKWSTLELKRGKAQNILLVKDQQTGKRTYQEGTILHTYDPKTGEWTEFDTDGPDVVNPPAPASKENGTGPGVGAKPNAKIPEVAKPPAPQPVVHTIEGVTPLFVVVSAERDRVTMINSKSQKRETFRLPEAATQIVPIVGPRLIGLNIMGPRITRVGFYDRRNAKWSEHALKEPATAVGTLFGPSISNVGMMGDQAGGFGAGGGGGGAPGGFGAGGGMGSGRDSQGLVALSLKGAEFTRIDVYDTGTHEWTTQDLREPVKGDFSPIVSMNTVSYRSGRFLYIYSAIARKWSVLELKREDAGMQGLNGPSFLPSYPDASGKMIIADGDVIHMYDVKTGEWTEIDTKDEK